jgi:uncharacterized protein with PIN domain
MTTEINTMKYEPHETLEETLSMPKRVFIERCLEWIKKFNNGKRIKVRLPTDCPLSQWVVFNDAKCHHELVAGTAVCPICGNPICPDCGNHNVDVISRVTGYLSTVGGWNEAKKQEFEDRNRYDVNVR